MKEVLEKADQEKLDCYLETVTDENVEFYKKNNFQSIYKNEFGDEYQYWIMNRKPMSLN